ncbi:hypothetical protein P154DRAFT_549159 [Amniculicola lignicola CBS 123094]|uniref:Steroid 5-alpha reductase C-terminal domain-containing protein n=1 Tax=Amniculicola lignicola CBS 123094 TaxID=1392246 RepID=A0A6A5VYY7_9PLEO|nr:hypothetical protein P154DRAFT_549159 [Amniculicola lignicola CBS 123094]
MANASIKDPRSEESKKRDLISRGDYTSTPGGKALFVLLRSLDPLLHYSILAHGTGTALLGRVGLRTLPPSLPSHTGISTIDSLGLSPYRLALLGMAIGSALKQNIWIIALSGESMSYGNALTISIFNTVLNGISVYAFMLSAMAGWTESSTSPTPLIVGGALYVTGILTELISEVQRKAFKSDPKNKGKVYSGGLWALARHINYGGYTLWRAGYAMAGGGWTLGAVVGAFFAYDFATRSIPILDEYCGLRYGEQWEKFKKQTPSRLLPWIY